MKPGIAPCRLSALLLVTLAGSIACGPGIEPAPDAGPADAASNVDTGFTADGALDSDAASAADGAIDSDATSAVDGASIADATVADRTAIVDSATAADASSADLASGDTGAVDDASGDAGPAEDGGSPLWCSSPSAPSLVGLSAEELHTLLEDKDFLLINVADSTGSQIPGTDTFIAHSDTTGLVDYIGPDLATKVVLYCASGNRSAIAGNALVARGYCSVRHLLGGRGAWSAAGYAFE